MTSTRVFLRRGMAAPAKRVGRLVAAHLPADHSHCLEVRAKRFLKRFGLAGPAPSSLPHHLPSPTLGTIDNPSSDHAECPLCGTRSVSFLPYGVRRIHPDRECPGCGSLERHRLVWLYFALRTDLFTAPARLLHIAPEPTISAHLQMIDHLDYLSADLDVSSAMVEMDITDIDRPDASFDVIYASHVLEHVPDDLQAMRELRRVLRPDGWAVLQVPVFGATTIEDPTITDPVERNRLFGQHDHVRMYGNDGEYQRRLTAAGFDVTVVPLARELGPDVTRRHRLLDTEDIYFCRPHI
ncbi:MAG: class I SAM-dependent methyltransferase [Aquihabitans sp.]